jgi:dihydrofolate reductase
MDPDIDFAAIFAEFDTVLLGRKTYELTRQQPGPEMPGIQTYVFSHTLRQKDCPGVTVSNNAARTLAGLKEKLGKDIWLCVGGSLFSSLLQLDLVDTVEVAIMPVLLGGGIPLVPHAESVKKLTLKEHKILEKTGTVALTYAAK